MLARQEQAPGILGEKGKEQTHTVCEFAGERNTLSAESFSTPQKRT